MSTPLDQVKLSSAIKYNEQQDIDDLLVDIQRFLNLPITRVWDEKTIQAIAAWQQQETLEVDGKVGPNTTEAFQRAMGTLNPSAPTPPTDNDLQEIIERVLKHADEDFQHVTSEDDMSKTSRLAQIFRDSGWSRFGVDTKEGNKRKAKDWCGMSVGAWLFRAGMSPLHRKSFFHTKNVEAFFTYGDKGWSSKRLMALVKIAGTKQVLENYHSQQGHPRQWLDHSDIRSAPLSDLDVHPGDVVLINYEGNTHGAHHIAMVQSWEEPVLVTIEGNARGKTSTGKKRGDAVVINTRDLSKPAKLKQLFGLGRLSLIDFQHLRYS